MIYCPHCKEPSCVIKFLEVGRLLYCVNKGCGFKLKVGDYVKVSSEVKSA